MNTGSRTRFAKDVLPVDYMGSYGCIISDNRIGTQRQHHHYQLANALLWPQYAYEAEDVPFAYDPGPTSDVASVASNIGTNVGKCEAETGKDITAWLSQTVPILRGNASIKLKVG
jgi:hypothetical protein